MMKRKREYKKEEKSRNCRHPFDTKGIEVGISELH